MNLLVTVLCLGIAPIAFVTQMASAEASARIEQHKIGTLAIGAPAEDVYERFPPERRRLVDLGHEGQLSPALELTLPGATRPFSVVAELGCHQGLVVERIFIKDPAFRTLKGLGVGSTVRELRAAYVLRSFSTEEGSAGVVVDALSATFELDQTGSDLSGVRTSAGLPDSVKIVGVLLWK